LFLRTVSSDAEVRAVLVGTGFRRADAEEGWRLLRAACAADDASGYEAVEESPGVAAEAALTTFARTMMPRARAALRRLHPPQCEFLFSELPAGAKQVSIAVAMFLERCDALERSPKRKKTRKEDHAALAVLEQRGLTRAAMNEARRELATVTRSSSGVITQRPPDPEALVRLHAWLRDWSDCARTVITRRDWLIRLGIGRRRPKRSTKRTRAPDAAPAQGGADADG
jgi:hypothetical protein